MPTLRWRCVSTFAAAVLCSAPSVEAATIYVTAGGDLQSALNAARPGDTVVLEANAEFVGNFVLPAKTGDAWITVRSSTPDSGLPSAGYRINPGHAALLARLRSPSPEPALRTAPGAHHWALRYLEFRANQGGLGDLVQIGDGSSAQNSLALVPHHIVLDHLYVHGDPYVGQKRCVALNAATVTISDSYVADCKGIGQDTQAIGGWNGPGPYTIENNYLEAAGENVMFGGADPAIRDLVADGITIRRNYFSRPLSWRSPLVSTPGGLSAAAVTGGSLPAGVYAYRVVARRAVQMTTARSTASADVTATTTAEGAVRVRWQSVAGASEYWVYGRTPGGQSQFWVVSTTEFIDTGAAGTSGSVPTSTGTVWTVKNLFELKNARNVTVQNNVFENHWKEAQPGWAIVLTPRNSQGTCTWCEVENVRFEGNLVQNVSGGINILGFDNGNPSGQASQIIVSQNVFRMSTTLGGNARFMQLGDGPRDITIEHNTIDSNGNTALYVYGTALIDGFKYNFNASRHGSYGINSSAGYGFPTLNKYFPGYEFRTNYLAGAPASRYPVGTLVTPPFEGQYVDSPNGNYTVRESSFLKGAVPDDGSDVGADFPALEAALQGVKEGEPPPGNGPPPPPPPDPPIAAFTASCQFLVCTLTSTSTAGTAPINSLSWSFGDGSPASTGSPVSHTFAAAGSYTVTLTATDVNGLADSASKAVSVQAPIPPTAGLSVSCTNLSCDFADASTAGSGAISSRSWTFGDGTLAVQVTSGTHTFANAGTYAVTVTVTDVNGLSSSATTTVTVTAPSNALHVQYSGITTKWTSPSGATTYWSATVTVALHDTAERPIAGATLTAAWSGALVKTVTCVTDWAGKCVLKSGTLSYGRSWVTLNVTSVVASDSVHDPTANHNQSGTRSATITLNRP